jgi:hypothetical protein
MGALISINGYDGREGMQEVNTTKLFEKAIIFLTKLKPAVKLTYKKTKMIVSG